MIKPKRTPRKGISVSILNDFMKHLLVVMVGAVVVVVVVVVVVGTVVVVAPKLVRTLNIKEVTKVVLKISLSE